MSDWILAHPYQAAVTALAVTTGIAIAIRGAIPLLTKLADLTSTKADNEFLLRLAPKLDTVIAALDVLRRLLPRVVVGPLPSTQPIASASGRPTMPPSSTPPMKSLSAPPPPKTTLKPWPEPVQPQPAEHEEPHR
jgi:hypothetical protein